jgi:hypothetical protein
MNRIEYAGWRLAYGNLSVFAIACWMTATFVGIDAPMLIG